MPPEPGVGLQWEDSTSGEPLDINKECILQIIIDLALPLTSCASFNVHS